jgi:hypothetical protein
MSAGSSILLRTLVEERHFANPNEELRREYYRRLSPILTGDQFEVAFNTTEGFSFA